MHHSPTWRPLSGDTSDYIDTKLRKKYPAIGQDIKIMGLRDGNTITLTIACAIVDAYCADIKEYQDYMAPPYRRDREGRKEKHETQG